MKCACHGHTAPLQRERIDVFVRAKRDRIGAPLVRAWASRVRRRLGGRRVAYWGDRAGEVAPMAGLAPMPFMIISLVRLCRSETRESLWQILEHEHQASIADR